MISKNFKETIKYARDFTKKLKGGEVIGLVGDLGSGKTVFTKGLAKSLGVKENITSPTFVILKEYVLRPKVHTGGVRGVKRLVHVDAYRTGSVEDIKSVGIQDYFNRADTVVVIEWAEKIKKILPKNTIFIKFTHLGEQKRKIAKL